MPLPLPPTLPSLGHGKGPHNILCLLLLMSFVLHFLLIFLVKYEVECSREPIIGTVVTENGVHGDLRDDTKNNGSAAGQTTSGGSPTGRRATGWQSAGDP